MTRLASLIVVLCAMAACTVSGTKQDWLAHQAGLKLDRLEALGCPDNKLFMKWTFMLRRDATIGALLALNEKIDRAIEQCPG